MNGSEDVPHWLDFQGIAASVVMALQRASQARLTGDLLRLVAFSARTVPPDASSKCDELRSQLMEIQDDHLHAFGRELRRSTLLTAIGILDFCLFEVLVFMVSVRPEAMDRLPKDLRKGGDPLVSAKESLKRTSIDKRLRLVGEVLQVNVDNSLREELKPLLDKRHAITHHSKFYETASVGETVIQAQPFPEVSYEESTGALIVVTEIADYMLTEVASIYFHLDLGDLRPLNPAVAEFNRSMRLKIIENRARGPEVEVIEIPNWDLLVRESWVCVADEGLNVTISPTGIDRIPVAISCPRHDVHGEKALVAIDGATKEEAGFMNASFLGRLLAGKSMLLEYHSIASDVPLYVRLSLLGFPSLWADALAIRAAQADET